MSAVRPLYLPAPYQDSAQEGRLILRDGSTATIRLLRPEDRPALQYFFTHLSLQSRRLRFFSETKPGMDVIDKLCDVSDPGKQITLVVTRIADHVNRIIATGSCIAHSDKTAEFAVAVDDAFQGKGLGALILERLAVLAASNGFVHFIAITDSANHAMLEVFRHSGFQFSEDYQDGYVQVDMDVAPREQSVLRSELRDQIFTKASLRAVFSPRSVAIIGASRDPASFGHRLVLALQESKYTGAVYPINPRAAQVGPWKAYASLRDVTEPVDLAFLAVPREHVLAAVDDCAERGVRALVVISAGFAETGDDGARLQQQLVEKVRGYGMRLVGPTCFGVVNTDPAVRMNGSLAQELPKRGRIALSSQSGALGMALLTLARKRGLGLSMFISMGNKADVTGNDLLLYWEDDADTDVIALYIESFGNPRRFARIARRVSRVKPIVCVKSGRAQGATSARGFLEAALHSSDTAVNALFRQTGVIRADTLEDMFDLTALLGSQPLPKGRRTGIVTNSHGAGQLCADAARAGGLEITPLSIPSQSILRNLLHAAAGLRPMIDLTAAAHPEQYRAAVEHALPDHAIDALIVICTPIVNVDTVAVLKAIHDGVTCARVGGAADKPVVIVMMREDAAGNLPDEDTVTIPRYLFPEKAARVLAMAADYAAWRARPPGNILDFDDARPQHAREICARAVKERGDGWLSADESAGVLRAFGVSVLTGDTRERGGIAETDVMIGMTEDPVFGPLIAFGLAGIPSSILQDVEFRVTPLTDEDAREMVRGIRGYPLLLGQDGQPPADLAAIAEILLRVSLMIEETPEIRELELNPVTAREHDGRCNVLGARIRVAAATRSQPARYAIASSGGMGDDS
ncbi:MAG: GNAT family N-acetyltransferase [bacterium]